MRDFFSPQPRSLAHRGNSLDFPENTEASFRSAFELGVDVIETDVRLMKDGEVLLFHDPDLSRHTGEKRLIKSLTIEDLAAIDMGFRFSRDQGRTFPWRGKGIRPFLLKDALRLFPETRFNIDLKDPGKELAHRTAGVIREAKAEQRVCIGSFHYSSIKAFRDVLPGAATSLCQREMTLTLMLYRTGWTPDSVKTGRARAVQIPEKAGAYRILRPSFFRWCRKNKLALQVWTINKEEKMRELFSEGVDGIFSDIPEVLVRVCKDYSILAPPKQISSS